MDADAWVVAALVRSPLAAASTVLRAVRIDDVGLTAKRDDRLAGGNAAEDAAGMVREEARPAIVAHAHLVGILLAREHGRGKAFADLDALDRVIPMSAPARPPSSLP